MYSNLCYVLAALVEYKNISKKTLQESIESEMSGNLEKLLVAVGEKDVFFPFLTLTLNNGPSTCSCGISLSLYISDTFNIKT